MKKNIGRLDRLLRGLIALVLFALAYWQSSVIALLLGLFTLYEVLFSWCLMYQILGKNSCDIKDKR